MKTRVLLRLACGGVMLLLAGWAAAWSPAMAGGGTLLVTDSAAAFAVTLDGAKAQQKGAVPEQRLAKQLGKGFATLLREVVRERLALALPEISRRRGIEKRLERFIRVAVKQQASGKRRALPSLHPGHGHGGGALAPEFNGLGFAMIAAADGLLIEEGLQAELTFNGADWSTTFSQRYHQRVGDQTLVVDYTGAPVQAADGFTFAAFVRPVNSPSRGMLLLIPFDSRLPELLAQSGLQNADLNNQELTLPFEVSLTGSATGSRTQLNPPASAGVIYSARSGVAAVGAPPALAAEVQTILQSLPSGN